MSPVASIKWQSPPPELWLWTWGSSRFSVVPPPRSRWGRGSAEGSSLLLALGIPHNFYRGCSFQLMRAPSQVNSRFSSLFAIERILSMCDVLVDTSTCGGGNLASFGGHLLCHCSQWFLSCCNKGLGCSSLVVLGSGGLQSLWYVGDSCPDMGFWLLSHCGAYSTP